MGYVGDGLFVGTSFSSDSSVIVTFGAPDELPYAQNIQKYITEFQVNAGASSTTDPCELDQIAKLKSLLDAGAITEEEFEAKKTQLLGL